ncbi:Crp/Fnr family transcriptional regulator [Pedobacter alpinus]|uniref:Crp/Fnr family transcriptional regulator n=2 Tax=Pedobacter alpinus TaxID=1590643 RepID=A0ABW5TXG4_9SPHI
MNLKDVELLKHQYLNEMFSLMNFTEEEWEVIISLQAFRQYKKGTILLKEGQFSKTSFYVIKGCLRSYYLLDGEEKINEFYTERDYFTPSCLVTNKPAEHYLDCLEDCLVNVSTAESETIIMEKFPRFEKLCRAYSEELVVKQKSEFDRFKIASQEQRYINFATKRPDLMQRVPQYQIASYLGLTPQSLSRIRKRLVKTDFNFHRVAV